jgi:hypothetical protein
LAYCPEALIKILTNLTDEDRRMLSQIVERWGDLSDKLKRAVLKMYLSVLHTFSASIFLKYDRAKVTFGSIYGRKPWICLVCHPSSYSILIVHGFDYFRNFLSRLSGGGSEKL